MTEIHLTRSAHGLVPSTDEAVELLQKIKIGTPINATIVKPRNGKFHRKFFSMLDVAFQNHEWPEVETQWGKATVSSELFRKYVIVKAGHYKASLTPKGEVRAEPKSISFSSMSEAEFSKLYNDVLNVILKEFLTNWKAGDMDKAVDILLGYA